MSTKNEQNEQVFFYCEICDYNCLKKYNYDRHILTSKHKKQQKILNNEKFEQKPKYTCDKCNKIYKDRAGLWRHNKKCGVAQSNTTQVVVKSMEDEPTSKELIMILIKENSELKNMMMDVIKNGTNNNSNNSNSNNNSNNSNSNNNNNSHNKTFNLQFFLNETCKDAINLTDFINSIVLQLSDIDNIGEVGLAKGLANRIVSEMNLLGETKRPIHCTDVKREVMYVKDENKWEKDVNKEKIRHLIKKMNRKLNPPLVESMNEHNKTHRTDSEIIKHQQKMYEVFGGNKDETTNEDEIIRHISKSTVIN